MKLTKIINPTTMGIFIMGLMIFSLFAYGLSQGSSNKMKYNGYTFYKDQNGWWTKINGNKQSFYYSPTELEHLDQNITIPNGDIKIIYNPEENTKQHALELTGVFVINNKTAKPACTTKTNCDFEVAECSSNTILLKQTNTSKIFNDDCLKIYFTDNYAFVRYYELIKYKLLGII